jgi:WS/DGAT/MGAT family acyltransferase
VRSEAIDRASPEDLVSLATDVGSAPMQVGAVLVLGGGTELDADLLRAAVAERVRSVPRLRQRLVPTPPGCGRPIWVDAAGFDVGDHVSSVECAAPGDEDSLLKIAAEVVGTRLPADRPLWRMTAVRGLDGDRTALIVAFHHVLADGIGGLAVLANLVDGSPVPTGVPFPQAAPPSRVLAREALHARLAAIPRLPASLRRVRDAVVQLRPTATTHAVACSLNRPTGSRRRFLVVRARLDDVRRVAHAHGATVNDVVLAAAAAALRALLSTRGEDVDRFVMSVPVSARLHATATDLGNQVGVIPIEVPATGDATARLAAIAERTRAAKQSSRAASTALLGPVFRLLARLGIFQWFIDRQRLVHTFVTNLRGPDVRLSFLDRPIVDVIPVAVVTGNVTVSLAVLSYAGGLDITLIADPDACPDLDVLRDALQGELDGLLGPDPARTGA